MKVNMEKFTPPTHKSDMLSVSNVLMFIQSIIGNFQIKCATVILKSLANVEDKLAHLRLYLFFEHE